jgi:hypothetical protein
VRLLPDVGTQRGVVHLSGQQPVERNRIRTGIFLTTGRGSRRIRAFSTPESSRNPAMTMPRRQLVDVAITRCRHKRTQA